jgi:CRISPR/Cas system CSM-associated protein Csm3 (group 7 of RAMP superfamily)
MQTRHIAHIIIEADTPLKVGSNDSDFLQDSPLQKDFNGLPMILGTSIAGVLRKDFDVSKVNDIFGSENGSKVIISNALLLDENMQVNEELLLQKSPFLQLFDTLPIREHTAITDKGVALEHSKFDEEVLYKGTRFKFSIEVLEDKKSFEDILVLLSSPSFRLGGGSTKGFGKLKILSIKTDSFDINSYGGYSSSLNHQLKNEYETKNTTSPTHIKYMLKIKPEDFFLFGSGFGDAEAVKTPVYEQIVDYENTKLSDKAILMPASSLKGAIAHRTAFHYNTLTGNTIEMGNGVAVVEEIFGSAKDSKDKEKQGAKGKALFSDCFKKDKKDKKVFDYVSIDRFTGGAKKGALFQEQTIAQKDEWQVEILLEKSIQGKALEAFESALSDITRGMLSLGGATTKGHGVFVGTLLKNGKELCKQV